MNNHWLDEMKQRLETESSQPSDVRFERLRAQGIINRQGEVTGKVHRWNAFLAIAGVRSVSGGKIALFRCLKPVFGMPGGATIDVRRESLAAYLEEGKKIITAHHDDRLGMWMEGCEVHLLPSGFIRTDLKEDAQDDVGELPGFEQTTSRV